MSAPDLSVRGQTLTLDIFELVLSLNVLLFILCTINKCPMSRPDPNLQRAKRYILKICSMTIPMIAATIR